MADFGRMARGIATGYLSAKIANTEANDRLKEDIQNGQVKTFIVLLYQNFKKKKLTEKILTIN